LASKIPKLDSLREDHDDAIGIRDNGDSSTGQPPWPDRGRLDNRFAGKASRYAGLPFVISVLKRLGFETLLDQYPEYVDWHLGYRIFQRIVSLLRIPDDEPVLEFLNMPEEVKSQRLDFVAPMHWRSILASSDGTPLNLSISPIANMPGHHLVMEYPTRLVLGVWHSGNKARIAPWLDAAAVLHTLEEIRTWNIARQVNNFVRAICRFLRRFSQLDLPELVRRSGYIAITRTHMDITMPLDELDIRVRSAGLDINPGWVHWLLRVIQFHYEEEYLR